MSCNYCEIDNINRRHLPLICRICSCKSFQFINKCDCIENCTHPHVPVCLAGHVNRPILTKTCSNASKSDCYACSMIVVHHG